MKSKRVEWRKIKEGDILAYGFPENLNPHLEKNILDDNVVFLFQRAAGGSLIFFKYNKYRNKENLSFLLD